MKKKAMALVLALVMVLSMLPVTAMAGEPTHVNHNHTEAGETEQGADTWAWRPHYPQKPDRCHKMTKTAAKAATCTTDGNIEYYTCSVCKKTFADDDGEQELTAAQLVVKASHKLDNGTVTKAATCTEKGIKTYQCTAFRCHYTKTEEIAAVGHKLDNGTVTKKATCTEKGVKTFECTAYGCHYTKTEEIAAVGHKLDNGTVTKKATCTEKGVKTFECTAYGCHYTKTEEIAAVGHQLTKTAAKAATCTVDGNIEYYTCTTCGKFFEDRYGRNELTAAQLVVKASHKLDNGTVTKKATCTEKGVKVFECTAFRCNYTKTEEIAAVGHQLTKTDAKAATCTENGNIEYYTCSVCRKFFSDAEGKNELNYWALVVKSEGHKLDAGTVTKAATCTEKGIKTYQCTVDGCHYTKTEEIALASHTKVEISAEDATCTEPGKTAGAKCSVCGKTLVAQETIPAKGHTMTPIAAKAPTCTEDGNIACYQCSDCNEFFQLKKVWTYHGWSYEWIELEDEDVVVKAKGHTVITIAGKAPTCTEDGKTAGAKCSVCGEVTVAQETIPAKGHNQNVVISAVAPTCTKNGKTAGAKCSVCGEVTVKQEIIPAKGHNQDVVIDAVAPTCTKNGKTAGAKCSVCGEVTVRQEIIPAKGHDQNVVIDAVAPTCTEIGLTAGAKCSVCGEVTVAQKMIPAKGHDMIKIDAKAATCTEDGNIACHQCTTCDKFFGFSWWPWFYGWFELKTEDVVIDAKGHDQNVVIDPVAPTCTETGLTAGAKCSVCGEVTVAQEKVDANGHDKAVVIDPVAPTCTETGLTAGAKCSVCGEVTVAQEKVDAKGHDKAVVIDPVAPTCTETGLTAGAKCSVCGEVTVAQEKVDANGHDKAVVIDPVAPTCTETGLTAGAKCSVCGEVTVAQEKVDANGHDKAVVIDPVAPTCTETGLTAGAKCSVCGEVTVAQEKVDTKGHDKAVVIDPVAPTCTETGLTAGAKCSVCGEVTVVQEKVDAKGHDKAVVIDPVAPTCTETGLTAGAKCSVCGEVTVAQEKVDAKGHDMTKTAAKAATCTEAGNVEYYTCSVCEKTFADEKGETELKSEELVVKAAGHDVKKVDGKAATYIADGNKEFYYCEICKTAFDDAEGEKALTESQIKDLVIPQLILVETDTAEVSEGAVDKALGETKEDEDVTLDLTHKDVVGEEHVDAVAKAELPVAGLDAVAKEEKSLTLVKEDATVTLDTKALEAVVEQAKGSTVTLVVKDVEVSTLQPAQQAAVENKEVALTISAELICDATGEKIATEDAQGFGGGTVTVAVPVPAELPEGVTAEDLQVWYVADDGTVTKIDSKLEGDMIVFTLTHFSEYVIAVEKPTSPATGDSTNVALYGVLAIMAVLGMAVVLKKKAF